MLPPRPKERGLRKPKTMTAVDRKQRDEKTNGRIAALDIGGHDLKVYVTGGGEPDCYLTIPTNLRGAVGTAGGLDMEAYEATRSGLQQVAEAIKQAGAEEARVTTCSAGRSMNSDAIATLRSDVESMLNADLVIVPGEMEAELGFYGALSVVSVGSSVQKVVTVDVGGGSTELAAGTLDRGVTATVSMPVGGSSLKQMVNGERFDVESVEYAVDDFVSDVDLSPFRWAPGTAYVIIGGIASTLAAWMRDAGTTDPRAMDGVELLVDELAAAGEMFFRLSPEEMAESGCVIAGREDSIGYAGLVLSIVLTALKAQTVVVSSGGVVQALTDDDRWNRLRRAASRGSQRQ